MCGTEGKISPRKKLEACREEEDKREDNGLAEREDENNCNARDVPEMLNGTTYLPFNLLSLSMEINSLDIWKYNQLS